ncbi:hypothetical protein B0H13DRAFT_1882896 [Mycena leptocephala]|nr:hypothetical protein B0H13DRAFT_1882896 [Mycena leptocephala]
MGLNERVQNLPSPYKTVITRAYWRIRILCCTDAVGMGCDMRLDMRNIERVTLWKHHHLSVERLGEAILFVPAKVLKDGVAEEETRLARVEAAEPQNQEGETDQPPAADPADTILIAEGGARVEQGNETENAEAETAAAAAAKSKKKHFVLPEGAQYCYVCDAANFNHWDLGSDEMQEVAVST